KLSRYLNHRRGRGGPVITTIAVFGPDLFLLFHPIGLTFAPLMPRPRRVLGNVTIFDRRGRPLLEGGDNSLLENFFDNHLSISVPVEVQLGHYQSESLLGVSSLWPSF